MGSEMCIRDRFDLWLRPAIARLRQRISAHSRHFNVPVPTLPPNPDPYNQNPPRPGNPDNFSTSQTPQNVIDLTPSSPAYGWDERDALPSYSHSTTHTTSFPTHDNSQLSSTDQAFQHPHLDDESIDPFASSPSSVHSEPLPTLYIPTDTCPRNTSPFTYLYHTLQDTTQRNRNILDPSTLRRYAITYSSVATLCSRDSTSRHCINYSH